MAANRLNRTVEQWLNAHGWFFATDHLDNVFAVRVGPNAFVALVYKTDGQRRVYRRRLFQTKH